MCGLVGIAGDTLGVWKDIFTELLLIDSVRGTHSTGAAGVGRHNLDFHIAKAPGHPFNLFYMPEYEKLLSNTTPVKVLIGHNRYATIGEHTEENAHPFAYEHVVGAHNGTLDKFSTKSLHNAEGLGTDSAAIFSHINEYGIEETIKLLSGAWALTWFDKRDGTLNFLRNNKRPLYYTYSEDRQTIIWASEKDMLTYVLGRKNKINLNKHEIFMTTQDTHYSWVVPQAINKRFEPPIQIKREGRPEVVYPHNNSLPFGGGYTPGKDGRRTYTKTGMTGAGYTGNVVKIPKRLDTKKFRHPYLDKHGTAITRSQFNIMVAQGCALCGDNSMEWNDFIQIMGTFCGPSQTPFVCESCYNKDDVFESLRYAV